MSPDVVERVAAAIANARASRRGAPPLVNVLDILPRHLYAEVMDDARAALAAFVTEPHAEGKDESKC